MSSENNTGYLAEYGAALIDGGYSIIPIRRGTKFPGYEGWEKTVATHKLHQQWTERKFKKSGVGMLCRDNPAVDLDIVDEDAARRMEKWVRKQYGNGLVRVGMAPKRLIVYRTDEPFTKLSATYVDQQGRTQKVEILGDGQQFVAFAIHPDTNEPYRWLYKESPLTTPSADLPLLTRDMGREIIEEFKRMAEELGWTVKKSVTAMARVSSGEIDLDDPFASDTAKPDNYSEDELHADLLMVPNADDHDTWFQIGMALYHQFDGGDRGLELWHEWSSEAHNYKADVLDKRWVSFDVEGKERAPVTARLIIKLAKEAKLVAATETTDRLTAEMEACKDVPSLKEVAAEVKKSDIDAATRDLFVGLLRQMFKKLTRQTMTMATAKGMLRYENADTKEIPRWLEDWVYMDSEDRFYSTKTTASLSQLAFNSAYSRYMLTKKDVLEGRAVPERLPAHVALNVCQIPVVSGRRYVPGEDDLFSMNGVRYANLYTDRNVPEVPERLSKRDKRNLGYVLDHFEHLFPSERERELFIDWIAYIVQNPGRRPNWAVLLQGVEGDGKTFFGMLLGAMLGEENIAIVDPKSLEGEFNAFAEGHQVAFIEEVKLQGHNRYDVLNRIKPLITNNAVSIRRMRTDSYKVMNVTSYLLATNYRDALPLGESDSRYFVLFSRFQFKAAIEAFKKKNPQYYDHLYGALEESAGALRGWFLERQFGEEFKADGRAPESSSKNYMTVMAKTEEQQIIEEILAEVPSWDTTTDCLNATDLLMLMEDRDVVLPHAKVINKVLSDMGFTFIGKVRWKGVYKRFWSQTPERFMENNVFSSNKLRDWLNDPL